VGIDAHKVLCGNITDEQVRHALNDIRRYHRCETAANWQD
jgi:hypothetical protein